MLDKKIKSFCNIVKFRCPIIDIDWNVAYGVAHVTISDNICDLYITISDGCVKCVAINKSGYRSKGYLGYIEKELNGISYRGLPDLVNTLTEALVESDEDGDSINSDIAEVVELGIALFEYDVDKLYTWLNKSNSAFGDNTPMETIKAGYGNTVINKMREWSKK